MIPAKQCDSARLAAIIAFGLMFAGFLGWLIWIVWQGGWGLSQQPEQLRILGWMAFGLLGLWAVSLVALAAVNVKASAGVASLEIDGDGE